MTDYIDSIDPSEISGYCGGSIAAAAVAPTVAALPDPVPTASPSEAAAAVGMR